MTREILLAALEGLEARRKAIEEQIAQVRAELGMSDEPAQPARRNWKLGDAGKQRIADAQRKRWKDFRAKKECGGIDKSLVLAEN